jgi:chromosome segregation protein
MQLSKLEIKGFKSFGDKVVINFDEGITGIVGPNGCGKSNVVDAIRWVLGEQKTRLLRSDKMENVIFNGTKNRKPQQLAEVSLTFNNTKNILPTEYAQVTITRRYFRTGDSEYLLNGVTCRLKDITNLFLDTGIGPDSYAIIELKMVEDLLNDKNNSRRELFEEAAGISKYKIRKKESLSKLQDTGKDLERVEDLLFEVTKNMKSLEKQAKQTEKYYELKEDYKAASIQLAKASIQAQTGDLGQMQKDLEGKVDERNSLNTRINEGESSVEEIKLAHLDKEKLLSSRQKTLNDHVEKIRTFESEKRVKNERLKFLNNRFQSLSEQVAQDQEATDRAAFALESLGKDRDQAAIQLEETTSRLDGFREEKENELALRNELQERFNSLNGRFRLAQEELNQKRQELEIQKVQLSTLLQELEKYAFDSDQHSSNLKDFDAKLSEINERVSTLEASMDKESRQEETLRQAIASLETDLEGIREKLTLKNRELDRKQNEYSLTKSMVDNLEGFPEALIFLKKNSDWTKEAPLLSDILTTDERYRLALEHFLEPYMNHYIVTSEEQAVQAVNLLSSATKGKANFFILNRFPAAEKAAVKRLPRCVPALDIVEFDAKYTGLIQWLLQDVQVLEDDKLPEDVDQIYITQSGKFTKRRHSISGGSVGLFEGKRIGRAKNLEKLDQDILRLNGEIESLRRLFEDKTQLLHSYRDSSRATAIEELRRVLQQAQNEQVAIRTRKEQLSDLLSGQNLKSEDIQSRISGLQEAIAVNGPALEVFSQSLIETETETREVEQELAQQNSILQEKTNVFNEENIRFHQQQNRLNSFEQEINFKTSTFQQAQERILSNRSQLEDTENQILELNDHSGDSDDELVGLYQEKESIEGAVREAEKAYYGHRETIQNEEARIKEVRRKRDDLDLAIQELTTTLNETKLNLSAIKERLNVEFNLNLDEVLANSDTDSFPEPEMIPDLSDKVSKLKNGLERLGPINPMAMEAYQEIKERFDFITAQKLDLEQAKESLLATIGEIDLVARETFNDAFNKIRDNFINVFRSLFTEEDKCDLRLVDPDHPLESEIEIIAQPKGKRPLTINQLSGGEKTLTAISLLFAIYLLKPAPFCIFDEVDAPLDDVNIDKFNKIIRKFSSESQFIIVTHNKRTMSSTDIIYGITMIEQGVSRLVPVDLRALEESV